MTEDGHLTDDEFAWLVRIAPLVSMDLIVRDAERRVLVGLRRFEPAKNFYFVPGGRIRKNETLAAAFSRILQTEIGFAGDFQASQFLGVYQHLYSTNRFEHQGFGTHYVVLAYEVEAARGEIRLDAQHAAYQWVS